MKFEDLLMQQPSEEKPNLDDLQEEVGGDNIKKKVEKLHQDLDGEIEVKRALQCALQGAVHSCSCSSLLLPSQVAYQESSMLRPGHLKSTIKVKLLLAELKLVEEEIILLERKVKELNLNLRQEQRQTKERELLLIKEMQQAAWGQRQWHKKQLSNEQKTRLDYGHHRKSRIVQERRNSVSSSSSTDLQTSSFRSSIGKSSY